MPANVGTDICTVSIANDSSTNPYTFAIQGTAIIDASPPGAPTSVNATAGNAQATVSWTAPANDGGDTITGYTATAAPGSLTCTTTGATTCTVTGLSNGTAYTFGVTATNSVGTGTAGTSNSVTPVGGYTVTPSAGANGSISPNTPQTVNQGATASFTVTPTTGYAISSVTGCGGNLTGNTYVTAAITGNCTVTASFAATDTDGNGISDAVEKSIGENFGMSLGELRKLPDATSLPANALTGIAWVKVNAVAGMPVCLFDVQSDGTYSSHCLTIDHADDGKVEVTTTENGITQHQQSYPVTDTMVYLSLKKDGNAYGLGINGETVYSFTGSGTASQHLVGANLDQNVQANSLLKPLGIPPAEVVPQSKSTTTLLTDGELAQDMSTDKPTLPDSDEDGILTVSDNCPTTYNPDQADADGNGVGDACDSGTIQGKYFSNNVPGTANADTIVAVTSNRSVNAGDGNDLILSGPGRQDEYGEAGADVFAYDTVESRGDYLSDFTIGTDKIRLTKLLASVNYAGNNPITDGYVGFRDATGGCYLTFDVDGSAGKAGAMLFVYVRNVSCAALNNSANFVF